MRWMLLGGFVMILVIATALVLARPAEPARLPDGALPLALRTQPPEWRLPWLPKGCPLAGLAPVRIVREDQSLVFELADAERRVPVVFPYGFSGRLVAGMGELVSPAGTVVAREGDVLSGLMGESAFNGDFILCFDAATNVRVEPSGK